MENRYLFRAKRLDNSEWVIGSLVGLPNGKYEIANSCANPPDSDPMWKKCVITHIVDPSTICQCTGLRDKNNNLIWENDVVFVKDKNRCSGQIDTGVGQVSFLNGMWYIDGYVQNGLYDINTFFQIEVIDNILDNPNLLENNEEYDLKEI